MEEVKRRDSPCIWNTPGGTVPPIKMHSGGTLNLYDRFFVLVLGIVCSGKLGVLGQWITIKCLLVKEDNLYQFLEYNRRLSIFLWHLS